MKKARIILGVVAAVVALSLCAACVHVWRENGCGVWSLIAGCTQFAAMVGAMWLTIDGAVNDMLN